MPQSLMSKEGPMTHKTSITQTLFTLGHRFRVRPGTCGSLGPGAARFSDDKLGWEDDMAGWLVRVFDAPQQKFGHRVAHRRNRLADCSEHRARGHGDGRVVVAYNRDILGNPEPGLAYDPDHCCGHRIRRDEHAVDVWVAVEQGPHRLCGKCRAVVAGCLQRWVKGQSSCGEGVAVTVEFVDAGGHVERSIDRGDPPAAARQEVADRQTCPDPMVHIDVIDIDLSRR